MPTRRSLMLAATLVASIAMPVRAQTGAPWAAARDSAPAVRGPALATAPAAMRAASMTAAALTQEQAALQTRSGRRFSQNTVLMIVGGAAIGVGLLAGDGAKTALVIGGTTVALVGLYRYLRQ